VSLPTGWHIREEEVVADETALDRDETARYRFQQ